MHKFARISVVLFAVMVWLFTSSVDNGFSEEPLPLELENYIGAVQSGSADTKVEAARKIINSAITDQRLYAAINTVLLDTYSKADSGDDVDALAWLCKALATSGNPEYKATLETIVQNADSRKLRKYAEQSMETLADYVIIKAPNPDLPEDLSPEAKQYINMIQSGRDDLVESAASKVFKSDITEALLYDKIEEQIKSSFQQNTDDKKHVNAVAWMCKALASSGETKYRPTLEDVAQNAKPSALKRHAEGALRILDFEPAPVPGENESVLVIYRNNIEMSLREAEIQLDDRTVATVKNKSYTWMRTTPGKHVLKCIWDQPPAWEKKIIPQSPPYLLNLEPQKTYFLQLVSSVNVYINSKKTESTGEAITEGVKTAISQAPLGVAWIAATTDIDADYMSTFEPKNNRPSFLYKFKQIEPEKAFR